MLNVYKIADDYAESIMEEMEEEDLTNRETYHTPLELAEQYADGSEHVIYYHAAHEFVQALPFDVKNDAEQNVADCGLINEETTYNQLATQIAYFALQQLILDAVQVKLEEAA